MNRALFCLTPLILLTGLFVLQGGNEVSSQSRRVSNANYPSSKNTMPAHIAVSHRTIIANWIQNGWRPATKEDALKGQETDVRTYLQGEMRSIPHHPFYVARDFNRDGSADFAIVVTNGSQYAIAIFNGPFVAGRTYTPVFYSRQFEQGDFLFWMTDRQFGNRFIVGPPASDSGYILRPRGKGYRVE